MKRYMCLSVLCLAMLFAFSFSPEAGAATAATTTTAAAKNVIVPPAQVPALYMFMSMHPDQKAITWFVCGSTSTSSGCYGAGDIGPFGHACGVIANNGTVYVMDTDPANGPDVVISVYQKNVSTQPGLPKVTSFALPIKNDPTARCSMAVTTNYLYVGTNKSPPFAINRATYAASGAGAFGREPVTSMTATYSHEYVVINQGNGFSIYDKDNRLQMDGGQVGQSFFNDNGIFAP